MRLTLTSPTAPGIIRSIDIRAPGITIGSAPDNDWTPDTAAHNLGAVQAVVRLQDGAFALTNLGSLLPVSVNGVALPCHECVVLQNGDDISLGNCRIAVSDAHAAHDPFADLLGPGTLPLGTAPDLNVAHPFDMTSAGQRNAADPLAGWAQRPDSAPARAQDPLALFDAAQHHEVDDVFTDHTPSVLSPRDRPHDELQDVPNAKSYPKT